MYNYDKDAFIEELMREIYNGNIKMCRCLYLENIKYLYTFLWNNFNILKFTKRKGQLFLELEFDIKTLIKKEGYEMVVYTRNGKKRFGNISLAKVIEMYTKKEIDKTTYPLWVGNAGDIGINLKNIIDFYVVGKNIPVIALEKGLSKHECEDLNYLITKLSRIQKS